MDEVGNTLSGGRTLFAKGPHIRGKNDSKYITTKNGEYNPMCLKTIEMTHKYVSESVSVWSLSGQWVDSECSVSGQWVVSEWSVTGQWVVSEWLVSGQWVVSEWSVSV